MTDHRDPRSERKEPSFLSDDDPLAELARLVGYEQPTSENVGYEQPTSANISDEQPMSDDIGGEQHADAPSDRSSTGHDILASEHAVSSAQPTSVPADPPIDEDEFAFDLEAELLGTLERDGAEDGAVDGPVAADEDGTRDEIEHVFDEADDQAAEMTAEDLPAFLATRASMAPEDDVSETEADEMSAPAEDAEAETEIVATRSEGYEPQREAPEEPFSDDAIGEDFTDLPDWPISRSGQTARPLDDLSPEPVQMDGAPEEQPFSDDVIESAASFEGETDRSWSDEAIARSFSDDLEAEEPASDGLDDDDAQDQADDDPVWRDFARYDVPAHAPSEPVEVAASSDLDSAPDAETTVMERSFEPGADPGMPEAKNVAVPIAVAPLTAAPGLGDDWDIAGDLERAFEELGSRGRGVPAEPIAPQTELADDGTETFSEPEPEPVHATAVEHSWDQEPATAFSEDEEATPVDDASVPAVPAIDFPVSDPVAATPFEEFDLDILPETAAEPGEAVDDDPLKDFNFDDFELEMRQAAESMLAEDRDADKGPFIDDGFVAEPEAVAVSPAGRADLVFDISDVTTPDEAVEPVGEIDVPELPVDDATGSRASDDDLDMAALEAEFADVFEPDPPAPETRAVAAASVAAPIIASTMRPTTAAEAQASLFPGDPTAFPGRFGPGSDFAAMRGSLGPGHDTARPVAPDFDFDPDSHWNDGAATDEISASPVPADGRSSRRFTTDALRGQDGPSKWKTGAAAAVILVAAGLSAYAYFGGGEAVIDDEPRVIAADDEPLRVVPEDREGSAVPNQDQAVYDQVDGSSDNEDVNLVSRAEEPVDIVQRTVDPQVLPLEGRPSEDESAGADATAAGSDDQADDDPTDLFQGQPLRLQQGEDGRLAITPRRVRTSVVRADGTLVPADEVEEVAAADGAPSEDRTVSPTDADALAAGDLIESAAALDDGDDAEAAPDGEASLASAGTNDAVSDIPLPQPRPEQASVPSEDRLVPESGQTADDGLQAPVRTVRTTTLTNNANAANPVPAQRPADQPVTIVGNAADDGDAGANTNANADVDAPARPEETAEAAAPAAPAASGGGLTASLDNPGGYVVQIASQPSEEGARSTYESLAARYGGILGGRQAQIQAAQIPDRGTFYRVRVAGGTRAEAVELCERYQAAGGSCFVAQ